MKKLFSFFAAACVALTVSASQTLAIDFDGGWGGYSISGSTLTFSDVSDWNAGVQKWLGSVDWSAYDTLAVAFEPTSLNIEVKVEDNNGNMAKASVADNVAKVVLTALTKSDIQKYYIQSETDGTCTVTSITLIEKGGSSTDPTDPTEPSGDCPAGTTLTLGAADLGWESSFNTANQAITFDGAWKACGWTLNANWADYTGLYIEFAEAVSGITTVYFNGMDDDAEVGKLLAGEKSTTIALNAANAAVQTLMFKSEAAGTLTIACLTLTGGAIDNPDVPVTPAGDCPEGEVLTLGAADLGWESSFNTANQAITFDGAWKACGWTLNANWADYTGLYIEFAEAVGGVTTIYFNGMDDDAEVGKLLSDEKSTTIALNAANATVQSMMFKSEVAGTLAIHCLVLTGGQTTDLEQTTLKADGQKILENGHIYIIRNGVKYNAQGAMVK